MARKDEGEKAIFRREWCKRCGICVAFYPREAIAVGSDHQPFLAHPEAFEEAQRIGARK